MKRLPFLLTLLVCLSVSAQVLSPVGRRAVVLAGLASGGPFTPDQAPGMVFWFRSDSGMFKPDGTTPSALSNAVYKWTDKSANHCDLTNSLSANYGTNLSAGGPNGSNYLSVWARSGLRYTNNVNLGSFSAFSWFFVFRPMWNSAVSSPNNFDGVILDKAVALSPQWHLFSPGSVYPLVIGLSSVGALTPKTIVTNVWYYFSAGMAKSRTNGVPYTTWTSIASFNLTNGIEVAKSIDVDLLEWINLVEIIGYNVDYMDTATCTNIEHYFTNRYGLPGP